MHSDQACPLSPPSAGSQSLEVLKGQEASFLGLLNGKKLVLPLKMEGERGVNQNDGLVATRCVCVLLLNVFVICRCTHEVLGIAT